MCSHGNTSLKISKHGTTTFSQQHPCARIDNSRILPQARPKDDPEETHSIPAANRMSRLSAVLKNTGYLALAETAKPALSFLLFLVISRMLGREGVGSYTIILTFTGLFELIATLGLGQMIVRGIASDP